MQNNSCNKVECSVDESYLFMTAICFSATSSTAARERIL